MCGLLRINTLQGLVPRAEGGWANRELRLWAEVWRSLEGGWGVGGSQRPPGVRLIALQKNGRGGQRYGEVYESARGGRGEWFAWRAADQCLQLILLLGHFTKVWVMSRVGR